MQGAGLLQRTLPNTMTGYTQRTNLQRAFFRTNGRPEGLVFSSFTGIITYSERGYRQRPILPGARYGECARSSIHPGSSPWTSVTSVANMLRSRQQRLSTVRAAAGPSLLSIAGREEVLSTRTCPARIKSLARQKEKRSFRNDAPWGSRSYDVVQGQRKACARGEALNRIDSCSSSWYKPAVLFGRDR